MDGFQQALRDMERMRSLPREAMERAEANLRLALIGSFSPRQPSKSYRFYTETSGLQRSGSVWWVGGMRRDLLGDPSQKAPPGTIADYLDSPEGKALKAQLAEARKTAARQKAERVGARQRERAEAKGARRAERQARPSTAIAKEVSTLERRQKKTRIQIERARETLKEIRFEAAGGQPTPFFVRVRVPPSVRAEYLAGKGRKKVASARPRRRPPTATGSARQRKTPPREVSEVGLYDFWLNKLQERYDALEAERKRFFGAARGTPLEAEAKANQRQRRVKRAKRMGRKRRGNG